MLLKRSFLIPGFKGIWLVQTHSPLKSEIILAILISPSKSIISSLGLVLPAITGKENDKLNLYNSELLQNLKAILKTNDENIINKVENLVTENIRLKKTNVQKKHDEFNSKYLKKINEISVYIEVCNMNVKDLKNYSDNIKTKIVSGLIVLISKLNNKVTIVLSISDDLISKYDASKMIRDFSTFFGGKGGGGRRDLAQGGGSDLSKIPKVEEFISMLLNNWF